MPSDLQQLAFRSAYALSRPGRQQHLSILMYHRVLPETDWMRPSETTAAGFEWQMRLVSRYFNVLPLTEAVRRLKSSSLPSRAACITFDDGYADNFTTALPILQGLRLPATVFVATAYLDGGRMWNDTIIESMRTYQGSELDLSAAGLGVYRCEQKQERRAAAYDIIKAVKYLGSERREELAALIEARSGGLPDNLMMTTTQLRGLHDAGIEIGGHTVSHPILARLGSDDAVREIESGREQLASLTGVAPRVFAYPNGRRGLDYHDEHVALVKRAGFEAAVVTNRGVAGVHTDPFQLPRFTPWDKTSIRYLLRMTWNAHRIVHN